MICMEQGYKYMPQIKNLSKAHNYSGGLLSYL